MSAPLLPDPSEGSELKVEEVSTLLPAIAEGSLTLIDCREQDEWDFNRIPHATLIPLSRFMELAPAIVQDGKAAVIYCHHGIRSLQATSWLRSRGLEQIWSMSGGIEAWSERIDPSVPKY